MKKFIPLAIIALMIVSACKKDNKKDNKNKNRSNYQIDTLAVSLHFDEKYQFKLKQGSTDAAAGNATWTTSNNIVGEVNNNGLFTAKTIGLVTVKAATDVNTVESLVTIIPYTTLYTEPFFEANANIATTKGRETRTLEYEDATGLIYTGENASIRSVIYLFEGNKMTSASVLFANSPPVINEAKLFLSERYAPKGENAGKTYFYDSKQTIIAFSQSEDIGYNAIYFKGSLDVAKDRHVKVIDLLHKSGLKDPGNKPYSIKLK
ncbi:MAG: hypothetical protein EOP47_27415 [Sphingobacteriaceae bacterium]|nr:MAG: hypothetical protein EOP47_27415 [Sphingobacteriaceae bacterium]